MKKEIKCYRVTCGFEKGVEKLIKELSDEEKVEMLGYDDIEEYKEAGNNLDDLDSNFRCDFNYDIEDNIKYNGVEIIWDRNADYYENGCLYSAVEYKIKGDKRDIEDVLGMWYVIDYEEVELDEYEE